MDKDGGVKSSLYSVGHNFHQALHLMRRVCACGRGIKEVGLRKIALGIISATAILYGLHEDGLGG